jgi:hypothetical protein
MIKGLMLPWKTEKKRAISDPIIRPDSVWQAYSKTIKKRLECKIKKSILHRDIWIWNC